MTEFVEVLRREIRSELSKALKEYCEAGYDEKRIELIECLMKAGKMTYNIEIMVEEEPCIIDVAKKAIIKAMKKHGNIIDLGENYAVLVTEKGKTYKVFWKTSTT